MRLKNLDETDRQIVNYLAKDGRMSHAELGRLVNLTRAAVRERVNRLIESGVIDRFTIVVNPLKAGKMISMYLNVSVEWTKLDEVVVKLAEADEITNIYQMSGPPHLHVHALFDDQEHANRCIRELQSIDGIISVDSEILLARCKERGALLI